MPHMHISGMTSSGKTFFLNHVLDGIAAKPRTGIVIFGFPGEYDTLIRRHGGTVMPVEEFLSRASQSVWEMPAFVKVTWTNPDRAWFSEEHAVALACRKSLDLHLHIVVDEASGLLKSEPAMAQVAAALSQRNESRLPARVAFVTQDSSSGVKTAAGRALLGPGSLLVHFLSHGRGVLAELGIDALATHYPIPEERFSYFAMMLGQRGQVAKIQPTSYSAWLAAGDPRSLQAVEGAVSRFRGDGMEEADAVHAAVDELARTYPLGLAQQWQLRSQG